MLAKIAQSIHEREVRFRRSFGQSITSPRDRRRSRLHFEFLDHAVLRRFWYNFAEIAPDVYRSNHPDPKRLRAYRDRGIKSVLNLRGAAQQPHYLFEKEACDALGLTLVDISFNARRAPTPEALVELIDTFGRIEKPFVLHCKSGADRAGMASALYLITQEGKTVAEVRDHLSWRYLHLRSTATGILDAILDAYEAEGEARGLSVETWAREVYDPAAVTRGFEDRRRAR